MLSEKIFDRQLLIKRRSNKADIIQKADFLIKRSLANIEEKLFDMDREFPFILNLGSRIGYGTDFLKSRSGTTKVIETDISLEMLKKSPHTCKIVCDEEFVPFAANQFDLIISILNLHNVNDLPGCLIQLKNILKPKGIIIASLFGENNLNRIKNKLIEIEINKCQGASLRFAPNIDIKQMGMLLLRAGFTSPVLDNDKCRVDYKCSYDFLKDLQNMAETNILYNRNNSCPKKTLWKQFYNQENLSVDFEILTFTASKD